MAHGLIIFDCDGTLVDSEYLYNSITAELLNELGFHEYTTELCIELFTGQAWSNIKRTLEDKHGKAIPQDIIHRYIQMANAGMERVQAAAGANEVVASLGQAHKICVASNGERNNVIKSLKITGLFDYFGDAHIFTKIQVAHPKPAPDLFLFAANQMGFMPEQCLVIEDSPAGITAAVTAKIPVIGFTGCAHDQIAQAQMLSDAGADDVISDLTQIRESSIFMS